jgi:hypothetical protein
MLRLSRRCMFLFVALLAVPALAGTQKSGGNPLIPKQKGPTRTVGFFNFLCLKQLPDLEGIERAAGFGEFDQLTGDDLKPYVPAAPVEKLFAWRYHDHGEPYVLTATRGKPDATTKLEAPAFADATSTACSLRVPGAAPDTLIGELTRLMGRPAEQTLQQGAQQVHTWTHKQGNAISYVRYTAPEKAGDASILSALVLLKN